MRELHELLDANAPALGLDRIHVTAALTAAARLVGSALAVATGGGNCDARLLSPTPFS